MQFRDQNVILTTLNLCVKILTVSTLYTCTCSARISTSQISEAHLQTVFPPYLMPFSSFLFFLTSLLSSPSFLLLLLLNLPISLLFSFVSPFHSVAFWFLFSLRFMLNTYSQEPSQHFTYFPAFLFLGFLQILKWHCLSGSVSQTDWEHHEVLLLLLSGLGVLLEIPISRLVE